jgi:hypothetical protein
MFTVKKKEVLQQIIMKTYVFLEFHLLQQYAYKELLVKQLLAKIDMRSEGSEVKMFAFALGIRKKGRNLCRQSVELQLINQRTRKNKLNFTLKLVQCDKHLKVFVSFILEISPFDHKQ